MPSLERIAHLMSPLLVCMVLSAASTAALPPASLPSGGGSMNTSEALSPVEEGDDPGNGSMTRSTIVAIPIVLGLAVILLLALYCLRHWTSIARRFFGKGSNRPLPDPRGLSDECTLHSLLHCCTELLRGFLPPLCPHWGRGKIPWLDDDGLLGEIDAPLADRCVVPPSA
ncbi:hypothetical protein LshimejAT787_0504180 [Lyophyllum shimeji]|uniref:Uncharacterized protein n=1 Tax=Lyophyllum shimeji TaxID=47721 RepID=A0A9P3PN88_LYOSH|nr:hypothetical protein LshimejAT787_0504180 [Lyophyllum shimeji]